MSNLQLPVAQWKAFRRHVNLFQNKFQGGAASGLEVSRAQAALSNVAAVIPDLERQIVAQENALDLLLGRNPGPIERGVDARRSIRSAGRARGFARILIGAAA